MTESFLKFMALFRRVQRRNPPSLERQREVEQKYAGLSGHQVLAKCFGSELRKDLDRVKPLRVAEFQGEAEK